MSAVEQLLDNIAAVDQSGIRWELKKLRAIREWALGHLGVDFVAGDRIAIADDFASRLAPDHGWYHYREALAEGATGTAIDIDFGPPVGDRPGRWYALVRLDREWSVSEWGTGLRRWWHGPIAETPPGYEPPSDYDQQKWPDGRKHTFLINVEHLRKERLPERVA